MAGTKPPCPPQFRIEAVRLVKDSGRPISPIAAELGVIHDESRGLSGAPRALAELQVGLGFTRRLE